MTEERFSGFFAEHFDDIWRFARRRTDSGAEADDVAAETFAVAWRRRNDVPEDSARLWLFGVARLVLANQRREAERRSRLRLRLTTTSAAPAVIDSVPPSEQVVWVALAALSPEDRELLLMRAWDGLGVADIATILQISAANASSRLHKARRRLDRELRRQDQAAAGQVSGDHRQERRERDEQR